MMQKMCLEIKALKKYGISDQWVEYPRSVNNEEGD